MSDRRTAGILLILYVVLDGILFFLLRPSGTVPYSGSVITRGPLVWYLADALLAWRIWRGGRLSRFFLILSNVFSLGVVILAQWPRGLYAAVVGAVILAQIAVLVVPAVRRLAAPRAARIA